MKWFLILFLSFSLKAEIPSTLVGPSNVNTILFKEMKTYMFQVLQKSQFFQLNENCRLYKFFNNRIPDSRRALKFCLLTDSFEDSIEQELQVQITGVYGGNFRFVQTGQDLKPLTLDQFINFQFPSTTKGMRTELYFDYFSFGLVIDRLSYPETLDSFLQIRSFQINIFENLDEEIHYRNYVLTCEDCEGVSWLRVQNEDGNLRYFTGNETGEVTPAHFNQMLGFFIITPLSQLGLQLKDQLISELRWPEI